MPDIYSMELERRYQDQIDRLKCEIQRLRVENDKLEDKVRKQHEEIETRDFRIRSELEPRLEAERRSYDAYVLSDRSLNANEHWQYLLNQMTDMVAEHPDWFDWEDSNGKIDQRILSLIKGDLECKQIIVFPSVFRIRKDSKLEQWLAVWLIDEIPQSCICGSEEQCWEVIKANI